MVIVKIAGGLGNQLFQYASAKTMAERLNKKLYIDLGYYNKYDDRTFKLKDIYDIDDEVLTYNEIPLIYKFYNNKYINYIIRKLKPQLGKKYKFICQYGFDIDNRLFLKYDKENVYLDGYWQNEEYFKDCSKYIRNKFTLKEELYQNIFDTVKDIKKSNSISVHIRRGDYMNKKNIEIYGLCPIEYYSRAIEYIASNVENPVFYFFSDDIEWVKNNIKIKYESLYIDSNYNDYEELYMMSNCKHNIIANSSFSWWGAWMNNNKEKIVIAPKKWTNKLNTSEQILPKEWIKM